MSKLSQITLSFWIMKICATTLGETAGDLLSMTLNIGYAMSSIVLLCFFFVTLVIQLLSKEFNPIKYWLVILATSTAGTTISDFMDRSLGLGYAKGSLILFFLLVLTLTVWFLKEKSLSVTNVTSTRVELFYWTAILFSNTLGTALGDFLADDSGLGFLGSALLIGSVLLLITMAYYLTKISRIILFWLAFILTRPFGATFGDLLTKSHEKGGLNFGTIGSSIILFVILMVLITISYFEIKAAKRSNKEKSLT
ncbi:MAG: hypothetical protein PSX42_12595 [bacterium]|nr:hypothetical protein [bacterium]